AVVLGMGGDQGYPSGHTAQGQRDAAVGGPGQASGNAVDHLYLDTPRTEPVGLFAAAAEDAWITAFQAHHAFALACIAQHQTMDKGLRRGATAAALADRDDARTRAVFEYSRVDQVVDQDDFGLIQRLDRLESQQFGITRASTYQPDFCTHIGFLQALTTVGWLASRRLISGTQEPQLVPHLSSCLRPFRSRPRSMPAHTALSLMFRQLHRVLLRALVPTLPGGMERGASSQRRRSASAWPSCHRFFSHSLAAVSPARRMLTIRPCSMRTRLPTVRRGSS